MSLMKPPCDATQGAFRPASFEMLQTQTWHLARVREGSPSDMDVFWREPRPWKAVKVDKDRFTFFEGVRVYEPGGSQALGVGFMCSHHDMEIAHPLSAAQAQELLS